MPTLIEPTMRVYENVNGTAYVWDDEKVLYSTDCGKTFADVTDRIAHIGYKYTVNGTEFNVEWKDATNANTARV